MADKKTYYYLKLKEGFFDSEDMLLLQGMKDGYIYKQIIRSIRKGSVQWNEEDRLQMVSMLAKAGYAVQIVRKEIPKSSIPSVRHRNAACLDRKIFCTIG